MLETNNNILKQLNQWVRK